MFDMSEKKTEVSWQAAYANVEYEFIIILVN